MQGRIDVAEEIPNYTGVASVSTRNYSLNWHNQTNKDSKENKARTMPYNNTTYLILRHAPMQNKAKRHQNPRQIRGGEDQQAEEAEAGLRIAAGPDINQTATEGRAEKWDRE